MTSTQGPQLPIIASSENVVFGDHNTQVIGVTGKGHDLLHFSITPRLPLELREATLRLRGRDPLVQRLVALIGAAQGEPSETAIDNATYSHPFSRVMLLHGAGGCGKTAIAEQVAYEVGRAGIDVWWVDAIDGATIEASMNAVASLIGASEGSDLRFSSADTLWRALAGRSRPWLLVVDGIDDPDLLSIGGKPFASGTGWVRPSPYTSGVVLLTSRQGAGERWGKWCGRWPVGGLKPDDGVLVLRDYVADRAGSETEAKALVERLSGLPLALKLAGSYLAVTSKSRYTHSGPSSFSSYKDALDNDRLYYLPSDEQDISRIWQLSVDLLERRGVVHARSLLRLLCGFADAPIPDQLLLDPLILAESGLFEGLDGTSLQLTMDSLSTLGLIDLTQEEPSVRAETGARAGKPALTIIHPLVRYATHQFGDVPAPSYLALAAASLHQAAEGCGSPDDYRSWSQWHLVIPHCSHLLHAVTTYGEMGLGPDPVRQTALAALRAAAYLSDSRLEEQAETMFRTVLGVLNKLPDDNAAAILDGREGLACVLRDHGILDLVKLEEAERELRLICAEREFMLERADGASRQLAQVGWRTPDGLALLEQKWEPSQAKPVLDMFQSYQNLAIALAYKDENSSEAKAIYQTIYEAQKRLLGENHRSTLASRTGLAARLYYEGKFEEAESEFRAIFRAEQELPELGPEHPDTIQDRSWLGAALYEQGRLQDAEYEWREVCAARRRVLGPEHSETLDARDRLAWVLRDQRRLEDAECEFRDTYDVRQRVLGPEHSRTLESQAGIAAVLLEGGQLIEAEREYQELCIARQRALGPEHPRTLGARVGLATVLRAEHRLEAAERELRDVYMVCQRSLGPEHNETLEVRLQLAAVLVDRGRQLTEVIIQQPTTTEGAYPMTDGNDINDNIRQVLAHLQEALGLVDSGKEPGYYGVILHDLGTTYRISGDLQQATSNYQKAITYKLKRIPADPEDLAVTMEYYSDALIECGDLAGARGVLNQMSELLPQVEDHARRAVHLHTLGRGFEALGDEGQEGSYSEALNAYKGALDLIDPDADPGSYATVHNDLGDIYKAQDKAQDARTHYSLAVDYMRRLPEEKRQLASMLRDLALMELRIARAEQTTDKDDDGDELTNLTGPGESIELQ